MEGMDPAAAGSDLWMKEEVLQNLLLEPEQLMDQTSGAVSCCRDARRLQENQNRLVSESNRTLAARSEADLEELNMDAQNLLRRRFSGPSDLNPSGSRRCGSDGSQHPL